MIARIPVAALFGGLLAIAFAVGAFMAQTAHATNYLYLQMQGGTEAGTANVSCGWHTACTDPPTSGNALDWSQGSGAGVYWDSYASYNSYSTIAGTATAAQNNGTCKQVRVNVKRPDGTALGFVYYDHSDVYYTSTFNINAGASLTSTVRKVATTAYELQACRDALLWTGYHLHQYAGSPFGTHWTQFPYAPYTRSSVDVTSTSEYQQYVTFEY